MNYALLNVGIGFTIGLQVFTALIIWLIMKNKTIFKLPYLFFFIAVLLQVIFRVDNIYHFLDPVSRLIIQLAVSAFTMIGFAKIYKQLKQ